MTIKTKTMLAAAFAAGTLFTSGMAGANPRPLPFTYPYETLPKGATELEIYGDMTPNRVLADPTDLSKGRLWEPRYTLQLEWEYGLTDNWELGFYQVFQAEPQDGGNNTLSLDGFKWRIRHAIGEPGQYPVDVGLYLELETMHDELSLEEKIIFQKRAGHLRWMGNVWVEETLRRPFDSGWRAAHFIVNPATGLTYQVTPTFHPGVEYWARGELSPDPNDPDAVNNKVHHFVGPTVHMSFGKLWWTVGVYAHLNDMTKPQPGEIYGPIWARSVLGIDL